MGRNNNNSRERNAQRNHDAARNGFTLDDHTTTTSSDDAAQNQQLEQQLVNLRTATNTSRNEYNVDLRTIRDSLTQIDSNSVLAVACADSLMAMVADNTYNDAFDEALNDINNTTV